MCLPNLPCPVSALRPRCVLNVLHASLVLMRGRMMCELDRYAALVSNAKYEVRVLLSPLLEHSVHAC